MRLALFIGDVIQSYETEVVNELNRLTKSKGYRLDIFANCYVPSGDFLHIEGLKRVFEFPDFSKYNGIISADDTLHNYNLNMDLRTVLAEKATCPVVCLRNSVEGCYNVGFDDFTEMYNMTKHLIDVHGCKDIGFVTGIFELDDSIKRLAGFKAAMYDSGLEVNEGNDIFNGNYWSDRGEETAAYFMNRPNGLPEAIICSNDYMAIALIASLKKHGIRCPEDVLITGLDNIPEGSENIPMLTTIDFNTKDMVGAAVALIERMNHIYVPEADMLGRKFDSNSKKMLINGKGIYRSSCGCVDVNDILVQNYKLMRNIIAEEYNNAFQCVNMNMDFGVVLEFEECVKTALQILKKTGRYKRVYAIFRDCLYAEVDIEGKILIHYNEEEKRNVSSEYPVSKEFEPNLEGESNVFFPVNYQDELYGYVVIQLQDDIDKYFDVVTAQLLIVVGNTLKKLELLSYQGELRDIKRLYQQDPLTNLYNRRGFENNLRKLYQSEMISEEIGDTRVIVSSIDLDGLKQINDNFGHFEGDRAIIAIAECLKDNVRENEFAARLGGDEFSAIILLRDGEKAEDFRRRLYDSVKKKAEKFTQYPLSVSVGLSEVDSYSQIIESMKLADADMYKEKQLHHNNN